MTDDDLAPCFICNSNTLEVLTAEIGVAASFEDSEILEGGIWRLCRKCQSCAADVINNALMEWARDADDGLSR